MIPHSRPTIFKKDIEPINGVIESNIIASSDISKNFRSKFGEFSGKEYVFLYSSGTHALYELLLSLEIEKGSDVLIPSYICPSVKKAIEKVGSNPVFYDNKKNCWISSYKQIKKSVTPNTKLIILNHTFGIRYKDTEIKKIKQLNIPIIEDNAHFISGYKEDIEISNMFLASFYSFHATKLLTTGEGGAITTNDKYLAKKIEENKLCNGMSDINATLGILQLERYNDFLQRRKEIAEIYLSKIKNTKKLDSIYFRFPILTDNVRLFLNSKKVSFRRGVDLILKELPNTKIVYDKTISIPIYPSLSRDDIEIIIDESNKILGIEDEN